MVRSPGCAGGGHRTPPPARACSPPPPGPPAPLTPRATPLTHPTARTPSSSPYPGILRAPAPPGPPPDPAHTRLCSPRTPLVRSTLHYPGLISKCLSLAPARSSPATALASTDRPDSTA